MTFSTGTGWPFEPSVAVSIEAWPFEPDDAPRRGRLNQSARGMAIRTFWAWPSEPGAAFSTEARPVTGTVPRRTAWPFEPGREAWPFELGRGGHSNWAWRFEPRPGRLDRARSITFELERHGHLNSARRFEPRRSRLNRASPYDVAV